MIEIISWWEWIRSWFYTPAPVIPPGQALLVAARKGHLDKANELLGHGLAPDETRTPHGETALLLAARYGRTDIAAALLGAGADPGATDRTGATPLSKAAATGRHDIIALFAKDHPEVFRSESAAVGLRQACLAGHPQAVAAMLEGGTPVDARPRGLPPALFAAATTDAACVSELLEAGANPHDVDKRGRTPLHHAAAANEHTCIRILLAADASLDARDNAGHTPMDLAITDFVRMLLGPMPPFPPAGARRPANSPIIVDGPVAAKASD